MVRASVVAADKVRLLHSEVLVPVTMNYSQYHQGLLFGDVSTKHRHVELGNFYELFSAMVFGGRLNNREYVGNGGGKTYDLRLVKADIVDISRRSVREIKGNKYTQQLNLLDSQMKGYLRYISAKPELIPTVEIYRHGFDGIKSYLGTREELFNNLASNTLYGLRLPLSVVLAIWSLPDRKGFERYGEHYQKVSEKNRKPGSKAYESCTRVKNHTLIQLLTDPLEFMRVVGLDTARFTVSRVVSPEDFHVGEFPISQFPILDIRENQLF